MDYPRDWEHMTTVLPTNGRHLGEGLVPRFSVAMAPPRGVLRQERTQYGIRAGTAMRPRRVIVIGCLCGGIFAIQRRRRGRAGAPLFCRSRHFTDAHTRAEVLLDGIIFLALAVLGKQLSGQGAGFRKPLHDDKNRRMNYERSQKIRALAREIYRSPGAHDM